MKPLAFILALLASLFSSVATAQPVPGEWLVGEQPVTYPVTGPSNNYIDGSSNVTDDGVPDFFATQPADIPSTVTNQILEGPGTGATTGNDEPKFRFSLHGDKVLADDFLRQYCQRGASHLHELMGSTNFGACSTFEQMREDCIADHAAGKLPSTNPGMDINCSAYWHPTVIEPDALGDGIDRIKKVLVVPLYYTIPGPATLTNTARYIDFPMGFGYVFGRNMDDPWNLKHQAEIAAANAANVASGGAAIYSSFGDGFKGWHCIAPNDVQRQGLQADISLLDCEAGDTLSVQLIGALCADGKNPYSPSGYDHVRQPIQMAHATGTNQDVCPNNWWNIPELVDKPQWVLKNALSSAVDGDEPYLSSDAMFQAKARADAGRCETVASSTVCAPVDAASFVCKPGCSAHADYVQVWMKKYLRRAFRKCLGIPQTDPSETGVDVDQTPFITACNADTLSTSSGTESKLVNPLLTVLTRAQVNGDNIGEYYPTPLGETGPHTMHDN